MNADADKSWEARGTANTVRLGWWTAAWVLTMAIATFGPHFAWGDRTGITIGAILINLAVGVGMIIANSRHLKGLDEMQQRIQLEAMALSLGAGLIVGLAYSNLDTSNVIGGDAEISYLVIFMTLTYMVGMFFGHRKYR